MRQVIIEIPEENLLALLKQTLELSSDAKIVSWWIDQNWQHSEHAGQTTNRRLAIRVEHDSLPEISRNGRIPVIDLGPAKKHSAGEIQIQRKAIA